jgi:hypothetical protein
LALASQLQLVWMEAWTCKSYPLDHTLSATARKEKFQSQQVKTVSSRSTRRLRYQCERDFSPSHW